MNFTTKIILGSLVVATQLCAEVITFLPYGGKLDYTDDITKSIKKDGTLAGLYYSYGNLSYLFEVDYMRTEIAYKGNNMKKLKQNDITVSYSRYYPTVMYKLGLHKVSTTDTDLGDGMVLLTQVGGYKTVGNNKYTYGVEGYFSQYSDAYDEEGIQKKVKVYQATPYVSFSKAINLNTRNTMKLKLNYIHCNEYKTKSYSSFEIEDTLYYKSVYMALKGYGGKMKSGIKDSGHTVYNLKDLIKDGYSIKLGYYINKQFSVSASYTRNNFEEFGSTGEASNNVAVATLSYSY